MLHEFNNFAAFGAMGLWNLTTSLHCMGTLLIQSVSSRICLSIFYEYGLVLLA
jgi:hypothetical protein